jgi:hypothetical protein
MKAELRAELVERLRPHEILLPTEDSLLDMLLELYLDVATRIAGGDPGPIEWVFARPIVSSFWRIQREAGNSAAWFDEVVRVNPRARGREAAFRITDDQARLYGIEVSGCSELLKLLDQMGGGAEQRRKVLPFKGKAAGG